MNVALAPLADTSKLDTNKRRLGKCIFDGGGRELKWTTPEAQAAFPIARVTSGELLTVRRVLVKTNKSVQVAIAGKISDHWNEAPLAGAEVHVTCTDGTKSVWKAGTDGIYKGELNYDRQYRLEYSMPGSVSKIVEVNTEAIPDHERRGGYGMEVNMRLFADLPDEDLSFLREPIGKAAFSPTTNNLAWDMDYSLDRLKRLKTILGRHSK